MPKQPSTKSPDKRPFVYRGTHDKILKEAIYPLYLLTARQVTRLLYPSEKPKGMFTTVQDRLNTLTREKYLQAYTLPTDTGPRPHVYSLALQGERLLAQENFDLTVHKTVSDMKERSYAWQYHLLELNNAFITAMIINKYLPGLTLFAFAHDYNLKKNPVIAPNPPGKPARVEPDGFLDIYSTEGKHAYFLLELDRYSHSNESFRQKIHDTIICYQQEKLTDHFNARKITILYFTTKGVNRVEQMRHLTRQVLKQFNLSSKSFEAQMFKFGCVPPLSAPQLTPHQFFGSPMWLTAYGQAGEEEVLLPLER